VAEMINGISHVDAQELDDIIHNPAKAGVYIIDVREPEEYVAGHIPGVPLLPMGDIPDVIEKFDKNAEYVLVCRSGRRSFEVAKFFQSEGITNVHNYLGGMLAWDKAKNVGEEHIVGEFKQMNQLERKDQA
jgi:rhodanese-related sulfurtransferase